MKHLSRALSLAALVCATLVQAGHLESSSYSLNVGPTFNYARFRLGDRNLVTDANPYLPNIQGYLAGIHADFTYSHVCNIFARLRFDGRWNAGNVSFHPNAEFPNRGCGRWKVRDFRPEFDLGYTFGLGDCSQWSITPYTGVGYISLQTQLRQTATGVNTNPRRTYSDVYVPVGVQIDWMREECFEIGLNAEYRIGVSSHRKETIRGVTPVVSEKISLRRAQGFLVEVPLTWHADSCHCWDWSTKVVPYVDWNRFGNRKTVRGTVVPATESFRLQSVYAGLHVDFGVNF